MFASKSGFQFGYFASKDGLGYCNPSAPYLNAGEKVRVELKESGGNCYGDFLKDINYCINIYYNYSLN